MAHRCSAAGSTFLHTGWDGPSKAGLTGCAGVQSAACDDPFAPYLEKVALLCLRRIGDAARAAEVAERALARARRKIASSCEAASFSVWLYSIVREECLSARPPTSARASDLPRAAEELP
jgi:DNA-directed RNA polymerase specialized sigma24 family protein